MTRPTMISEFEQQVIDAYQPTRLNCVGDFGQILCYELHENPVNCRLAHGDKGHTFKELAALWGIGVAFLGEVIAVHCANLEEDENAEDCPCFIKRKEKDDET